jgi:hypothetical protein
MSAVSTRPPLPRGIRCHNPGNIRESSGDRTRWVGERATDDDPAFEEFNSAADGIRALAVTLRNYQRKHGLNTIEGVINRWAPPNGRANDGRAYTQNTVGYIRAVERDTGLDRAAPLDLSSYAHVEPIVQAIIRHENGDPRAHNRGARWYPQEVVDAGLAAAGIVKPASKSRTVQTQTAQGVAAAGAGAAVLLDAARGAQGLVQPGTSVATVLLVLIIGIAAWQVWRKVKDRGS